MSEFMYGKEKYIEEGEQIIFENNTDSSFGVETGIVFHKSGLYDVDISNNHVVISKVDERKAIEEAYQKGFEVGSHETTTLEYQQGLDDAWECAKRIVLTKTDVNCPYFTADELIKIFGYCTSQNVLCTYSASEAIEKVKAYEEQQKADAEIKVGDEIKNTLELMNNAVGYFIEPTNNEYYRVLRYVNGKIDIVAWHKENCVRTGKHSYAVERMYVVLKDEQSCSSCEYCNDPDGVRCRDCCGYNKWEPKGGED